MNPVSISPIGLFLEAGIIGKAVMLALFLVSIWCWFLIVEAWIAARRLWRAVGDARGVVVAPLVAPVLSAGDEAAAIRVATETHADRRWRIGESMTRAARGLLLRAEGGLPGLAVISSTAPFVGLFGTVWGIMSSFAGIAEAKDRSLAVVAPGIAEALAATAFGLAAAIPASIGYNRLAALFSHVSADLDCLVQERTDLLVSGRKATQAAREAV
ncbi:MotA/TolQ/ExbB proton channel family protein [Rhodoblastus acidophilus]|uniref:MotA/TolQ/ExbB proton channel family protein n=1 Tax=Candidatus Rhodoblastus alkanivorans TaxID=2954117 RepID=A0ABS9ZAF1_9HYPH|nr:MotA/TolQ/ExbB proton channel family protein [Candidatus Rhodoblastus alkanivorans]MCI4677828.1 MotA/TolQ/ExbB proton channel family protein [Candidatus Rhodoblastus alkanivorans]MCI4684674.1 MotA/TolQ/ExbB proton channel family protein [Candidatus Rhodoblastus alkanivorans]MDI4641996.1 MotA/TolQ/ExbB proton channel family protein [Rhodoblastus acidophilus]